MKVLHVYDSQSRLAFAVSQAVTLQAHTGPAGHEPPLRFGGGASRVWWPQRAFELRAPHDGNGGGDGVGDGTEMAAATRRRGSAAAGVAAGIEGQSGCCRR